MEANTITITTTSNCSRNTIINVTKFTQPIYYFRSTHYNLKYLDLLQVQSFNEKFKLVKVSSTYYQAEGYLNIVIWKKNTKHAKKNVKIKVKKKMILAVCAFNASNVAELLSNRDALSLLLRRLLLMTLGRESGGYTFNFVLKCPLTMDVYACSLFSIS